MAGTPNFANRTLYHGDNLEFLQKMNTETVHLIATDPPFNKSRDFHATPGSDADGASFQDRWSWRDDIHDDWIVSIQKDKPEVWSVITTAKQVYDDGMGAFLAWQGVRLLEMWRVLRDDGTIFLHCDSTAGHYLKALLDAIFGPQNFRNEIIWQRTITRKGNLTRGLARDTDVILRYSKSDDYTWNPMAVTISYDLDDLDEKTKKKYALKDKDGRLYQLTAIVAPQQNPKSKLTYEVMGVTRTWRWSKERMEREIAAGRVVQTKPGNVPRYVRYLDEQKGKLLNNVWTDIPALNSQANERTGYPTQKPIALYQRIIAAASNPGDIVLDPFCGCATTPVAAERLGRQWIGIDQWDAAHKTVLEQLEKEGLAVPRKRDVKSGQQMLVFQDITYSVTAPKRTDEGETTALYLPTPTGQKAKRFPSPRTQHGKLLADVGAFCQGCGQDYSFDSRVLEVDHRQPKSDGGNDAYENLTLLCPPCNKEKRDRLTLTGLQDFNRKNGYLKTKNEGNIKHGRAGGQGSRRNRRR